MILSIGRETAYDISSSIGFDYVIHEKVVKIAGLTLPTLKVDMPKLEVKYSFMNTYAVCDMVSREFFELLKLISRMAGIRTMVWKLAKEVRKTQRRVNALDKLVIPTTEETRLFIESVLDEREREAFFIQKMLKNRTQAEGL